MLTERHILIVFRETERGVCVCVGEREREREREMRERETLMVASRRQPDWQLNLQPGYVP